MKTIFYALSLGEESFRWTRPEDAVRERLGWEESWPGHQGNLKERVQVYAWTPVDRPGRPLLELAGELMSPTWYPTPVKVRPISVDSIETSDDYDAETLQDLQRWYDQARKSTVWTLDECECTTDTQRLVCTKDGEVWRDDKIHEPCELWIEQAKKRKRMCDTGSYKPKRRWDDNIPPKGGF